MPDNVTSYGSLVERRYHTTADGVSRADAGLRRFARREGDAVYCRRCDGNGYLVRDSVFASILDPIKCGRCGGEGLEPPK